MRGLPKKKQPRVLMTAAADCSPSRPGPMYRPASGWRDDPAPILHSNLTGGSSVANCSESQCVLAQQSQTHEGAYGDV